MCPLSLFEFLEQLLIPDKGRHWNYSGSMHRLCLAALLVILLLLLVPDCHRYHHLRDFDFLFTLTLTVR